MSHFFTKAENMRSTNQREICILDLGPLKTEFCLSQFAWGGGGGGGDGGGEERGGREPCCTFHYGHEQTQLNRVCYFHFVCLLYGSKTQPFKTIFKTKQTAHAATRLRMWHTRAVYGIPYVRFFFFTRYCSYFLNSHRCTLH